MSKLIEQLSKKECDIEYVSSILDSYEENTPIVPNNKENHFNVFNQLFEMGLVIKSTTPIWHNSSFKGTQVDFIYNHELDYDFNLF